MSNNSVLLALCVASLLGLFVTTLLARGALLIELCLGLGFDTSDVAHIHTVPARRRRIVYTLVWAHPAEDLSMEKGKDAFLGSVHILFNATLKAEPLELDADQFVACHTLRHFAEILICLAWAPSVEGTHHDLWVFLLLLHVHCARRFN